jgi:hypothetical protein
MFLWAFVAGKNRHTDHGLGYLFSAAVAAGGDSSKIPLASLAEPQRFPAASIMTPPGRARPGLFGKV